MVKCKIKDCSTIANFGIKGSNSIEFCSKHKINGYANLNVKLCKEEKCIKQCLFGKKGTLIPEFCFAHKPSDYVDVKSKKCLEKGCGRKPTFGLENSTVVVYCKEHKLDGYINVRNRRLLCIKQSCNKIANFGKQGTKKPEYCKEHKLIGYVDVKNKTCKKNGCNTRPTFGKKGTKTAEYCARHKPKNYINIADRNRVCKEKNCTTLSSFGKIGTRTAEYCVKHKPKDYVNVVSATCKFSGCLTRPNFHKKGSKIMEFCTKHKPDGYDSTKKVCLECDKFPIYGKKGTTKAEYCKDHSPEGYVDLKRKICGEKNCGKMASYALKGQKAKFCFSHRPSDNYINVKVKRCFSCDSRASFNFPGNPPEVCAKHKKIGMIFKPTTKCKSKNCKDYAIYGIVGSKQMLIHCETHHTDDEQNMVEQECFSCGLPNRLNPTTNKCGECEWSECHPNTNPNRLAKQREVRIYLHDNEIYETSYDQALTISCQGKSDKKYRPDYIFKYGEKIIVLEVDENQHSEYGLTCENVRMFNLCQDLMLQNSEVREICFIRYNPDKFKYNRRLPNNEARLKTLVKTLKGNVDMKGIDSYVLYLFYDTENSKYVREEKMEDLLKSTESEF